MKFFRWSISFLFLVIACFHAYNIRLYAIKDYGKVIHEFDPWFNYRATQYLADNGWKEFFSWFDYMSWYPLGRPVGTTIFPGMQIIAVILWRVLNQVIGIEISLNDVCVFIPAWFGILATILSALLAFQASESPVAAAICSLIVSILPAHLMRSVAGGFDNESVAVTFMLLTFACWVQAIIESEKNNRFGSALWGILTGFSYIAMVASWGGFIFVLNLIASHCMILTFPPFSRYNSCLHLAYSLFFLIGTAGATRIPVVGWQPLKSLEQLSGVAVFLGVQVLEVVERRKVKFQLSFTQVWSLRAKYFFIFGVIIAIIAQQLFQIGYFSPFSSRIRALFVEHTRTGNPLVDSVAEHQPAKPESYNIYLPNIYGFAKIGFVVVSFNTFYYYEGYWNLLFSRKTCDVNAEHPSKTISNASSFISYYAIVAYIFCNKMSRLILLVGPVASILAGIFIGLVIEAILFDPISELLVKMVYSPTACDSKQKNSFSHIRNIPKYKEKNIKYIWNLGSIVKRFMTQNPFILILRIFIGVLLVTFFFFPMYQDFEIKCHNLAQKMSHPSIMFKAQLTNGKTIIVDDYREAYFWLRDSTPLDSRVLSWWDYGYQITGISNRTTLADGNTWNHEHIATIGRILTATPKDAHKIARHLADYVLVWAGGSGDDLAKSPHMARIGNSVYPGLCPNDPTCKHFGFYSLNPMRPTRSMSNSLLYKLCQSGITDGVSLDDNLFKLVFQSKFGKVRIFKVERVSKKSKKWLADPKNRLCDHPGSWYCPGQYPPALKKFINSRIDFKQLEDFNKKSNLNSDEYTQEYLRNMKAMGHTNQDMMPSRNLQLVGCYHTENSLPLDKTYLGGIVGSSIHEALGYAEEFGFKYVALANKGNTGHAYFFNSLPQSRPKRLDSGCKKPCSDELNIYCGCAEKHCGNRKPAIGENALRRWIVYEMPRF